MPDPQTTISIFRGFVEADRAKTLLESRGISAILVEEASSPFINTSDVVHLRVAESDASRALEILVAEGQVTMPAEDPDYDPPGAGVPTCRCPRCGRTFSTEYDFCPYCGPPADWLASAIPQRPALPEDFLNADKAPRKKPSYPVRDALAEWALYSALAGLCIWPLGFASVVLIVILWAAFPGGKMRPESWMSVTIALILGLAELGLSVMVLWNLLQR
jgi:hypothetical protein